MKVMCKNGHLVGIRHGNTVTIKKSGRVVQVEIDGGTTVEITCERCGEKILLENCCKSIDICQKSDILSGE